MAELRTLHDVKTAMRTVFSAAAGIADPTLITDDSLLYDPPPPAGDLGFAAPPAPAMTSLLTLTCRQLLGTKVAVQFANFLLPPDMLAFTTFGPLARSVHLRVNDLAERAIFLAICEALPRDKFATSRTTPITHPDPGGALSFAHRVSRELGLRICNKPDFTLTPSQIQDVAQNMSVGDLIEMVVRILRNGGCL